MKARAFTLTDFLLSATIIVITGAALPSLGVFKVEGINPSGRMSKSVFLYVEDNDGKFPLAVLRKPDGRHFYSTVLPTPADSISNGQWAQPGTINLVQTYWSNSIRSYDPSMLYREPSQTETTLAGDQFGSTPPIAVGLAMNGLLHAISKSAIDNPSLVPVIWAAGGSVALKGRAVAEPFLWCPGVRECHFVPGGLSQEDSTSRSIGTQAQLAPNWQSTKSPGTPWAQTTGPDAGGGTMAFSDGSSRFEPWGKFVAPAIALSAASDVYAQIYREQGRLHVQYWATLSGDCEDVSDANTLPDESYPCFFRPDRIK